MKKKLIMFLSIVISTISISMPIYANETHDNDTSKSNGQVLNEFIIEVPNNKPNIENSKISPKANDWEYKKEDIAIEQVNKEFIGEAANQPEQGSVFESSGGFFWQDGGSLVEISLGLTMGRITVNASRGKKASSGTYISAPVNTPCKLFIYKDIRVTKVANYKRQPLTSQSWQFTGYTYETEYPRVYLSVQKV